MQESRPRLLDLPFTYLEWKFFAAVIALNLALDIAAMWVEHWFITLSGGRDIPASWMEAFSLACLFSQIVILAIWAALFTGSNLVRVLMSTLVLCVSVYLLTWIAQVVAPAVAEFRNWTGFQGLTLIVVLFYVIQIPFWILRFLLGWRIVLDVAREPAAADRHRYTMLHILGWMAFLSVPLGLGQVYHGRRASDAPLVIGCLALITWLYGVPYLWATLRAKQMLWGLALCVPLSVGATLVGWKLYLMVYPSGSAALVLQAFLFVQGGAILAGLGTGIAARLFGYRLITHARHQQSASPMAHHCGGGA